VAVFVNDADDKRWMMMMASCRVYAGAILMGDIIQYIQNLLWIYIYRHFHPDARGQYTYWSIRTFARGENRGLRVRCRRGAVDLQGRVGQGRNTFLFE